MTEATLKPARTETFAHTITGLLAKRANLTKEAESIRSRAAEIRNDIAAVDRVLWTLGYTGDLDAGMPRHKREVIFARGELIRGILSTLRYASGPLSSREIAQNLIASRGEDIRDRKYLSDLTKRVSKAMQQARENGAVRSSVDDKGNVFWGIREATPGRKLKLD